MKINCKSENDKLDEKKDLFIIPIEFENSLNKPPVNDTSLHFSQNEKICMKMVLKYGALIYQKIFR